MLFFRKKAKGQLWKGKLEKRHDRKHFDRRHSLSFRKEKNQEGLKNGDLKSSFPPHMNSAVFMNSRGVMHALVWRSLSIVLYTVLSWKRRQWHVTVFNFNFWKKVESSIKTERAQINGKISHYLLNINCTPGNVLSIFISIFPLNPHKNSSADTILTLISQMRITTES